jgi:hypothetical protein
MAKAIGPEVITVDFKSQDVCKTILEAVPGGLDGMSTSPLVGLEGYWWIVCIDATTFHEPKTILHKVEKALMLETDVPETPNEVCPYFMRLLTYDWQTDDIPRQEDGSSWAYRSLLWVCERSRDETWSLTDRYTNHFNIGALMEKGVRFIGNGQAPGTSPHPFFSLISNQVNWYLVHLYWEEIMEYLKDGTFDTKFLVTHRVKLEDFPELYNAFDKRYAGYVSFSFLWTMANARSVNKVFVETSIR